MELKESKHPKPQSDEDALTVELRNEFALLNKIFELRETARDTSKKKLNRKAAKAAIKETKKTSNKNASLKAPKLPKPSAPPRKPEEVPVWDWLSLKVLLPVMAGSLL